MQLLPVEKWAQKHKIPVRRAYKWARSGKLPTETREIEVRGVPAVVTLKQVVKRKKGIDY